MKAGPRPGKESRRREDRQRGERADPERRTSGQLILADGSVTDLPVPGKIPRRSGSLIAPAG